MVKAVSINIIEDKIFAPALTKFFLTPINAA
jgi:hypothetical protein